MFIRLHNAAEYFKRACKVSQQQQQQQQQGQQQCFIGSNH